MTKRTVNWKKTGWRLLSLLICLLMSISVLTVALADEGSPGGTDSKTTGAVDPSDAGTPETGGPEDADSEEPDGEDSNGADTLVTQRPEALVIEQPVLVVTGQGLPGGARGSVEYLANEKAYTLDELRALEDIYAERLYSSINSAPTKMFYRGQGIDLEGLLGLSNFSGTDRIRTVASDGYAGTYNMEEERYFYPNFADEDDSDAELVKPMLAWKNVDNRDDPPVQPEPFETMNEEADGQSLRLLVGQISVDEVNSRYYTQNVNKVIVGEAIEDVDLTVLGTEYTRADVLLMPRAQWEFIYTTRGGDRADTVRGVPLAELLKDVGDDVVISFSTYDNWNGISDYIMTKGELIARNAMLAYEVKTDDEWTVYFREDDAGIGYFRLWVDGIGGAHGVVGINLYFDADNTPQYNQAEIYDAIKAGLVPESILSAGWQKETSRLAAADAIVLLIEKASGMTKEEIAGEYGWDLTTGGFDDTNSQAVTFLKYAGIATGVGNNLYGPEGVFNRAQAVTMIGRAAGACFGIDAKGANPFTDMADFSWAADFVGYAAENNIAQGIGAGRFNPGGELQNQQTALFLIRTFNVWGE